MAGNPKNENQVQDNLNKIEPTYNRMQAGIRNHVKENLQTYMNDKDSRLPAINGGIKNEYFAKTMAENQAGKDVAQQGQAVNQPIINAQPEMQPQQPQSNPMGLG
jgi:hypothetical protein